MKKSRYTEEQIIGLLKQHEAGVKTADLCGEHGISGATFYGWKQKFGGKSVCTHFSETWLKRHKINVTSLA